jgi:hypothetical protein
MRVFASFCEVIIGSCRNLQPQLSLRKFQDPVLLWAVLEEQIHLFLLQKLSAHRVGEFRRDGETVILRSVPLSKKSTILVGTKQLRTFRKLHRASANLYLTLCNGEREKKNKKGVEGGLGIKRKKRSSNLSYSLNI